MNTHKRFSQLWNTYKGDVAVLLAIAVAYRILQAFGITCPIRFLTGVSCAGCGMTRACLCALHGHFDAAAFYHPLWVLVLPSLMVFLFRRKLPSSSVRIYGALVIAAFLVIYLIRLFDPSDSIVVFAPREGAIYRLISWLM